MNASVCDPALGRTRFDLSYRLVVFAIVFPEVGPRTEDVKTRTAQDDDFPLKWKVKGRRALSRRLQSTF